MKSDATPVPRDGPARDGPAGLDAFYTAVTEADLQPLWTQTRNLMPAAPEPATQPFHWPWSTLRALAERAGELITIERGGERRVLALANPGLGGAPFATSTLWGAVQYLGPGESAPAHRHSPNAVRFVLEGEGACTIVDGDACEMHPGDLVLTPGGTWHDHENTGDEPVLWFDGLDMPLVIALDAIFYENHAELRQPIEARNLSEQLHDGVALLPTPRAPVHDAPVASPLLVYRWSDTDTALTAALDETDDDVVRLEYVDPNTGRSALPTIGCEMHRLRAGADITPVRRAGSRVVVVHRGTGSSEIDGQRFDWGRGDMIAVPSWAEVRHVATAESDLFVLTDGPALTALGLAHAATP